MLKMVIPIEGYKKNSMHGFSRAESSGVFRGAAGEFSPSQFEQREIS